MTSYDDSLDWNLWPTQPAAADNSTALDKLDQWAYQWPLPLAPLGVLLCALAILTVLGNSYVIAAVLLVRRLHRPENLLIVSLACADLLVGLLDMPFAVATELKGRWLFSRRVCDWWICLDVTVCTASILNLCMISIDRYLAITRPLHYGAHGRTRTRMALYVLAVWSLSMLISIPPLFYFGGNKFIDGQLCTYSEAIEYQLYATLGAFYIPLTVTLIVYGRVYLLAARVAKAEWQSIGLNNQHTQEQHQNNLDRSASELDVRPQNSAGPPGSIKRERKAMRTLSAITIAFVSCWLPFFIIQLVQPLCGERCRPAPWLFSLTLFLGYGNSTVNPFLYAYFNRDFRRPFRAILCCRCHRMQDEMRAELYRAQYGEPVQQCRIVVGGASAVDSHRDGIGQL